METAQNSSKVPVVRLTPPPKVSRDKLVGFNLGIRPYRKGGIRLEREDIKGKAIFHNYGHGGAGVSLAPGCARKIVDKFLIEIGSKVKSVAILGCGYMGLFQSIMLSKLGFECNIYAKDFPVKLGVYDTKHTVITSQVAGGLWMPYGYDIPNRSLHDSIARDSLEFFRDCMEKKKYKGLLPKDVVTMDIKNPVHEFTPGLLESKKVKVDFGNGVLHEAEIYKSFLIDGDIFLGELMEEAKLQNIKFHTKEFKSLDDVLKLKEEVIFNCSGWGSRTLFGDNNLVPYSGHLIYVERVPGFDYFLSSCTEDGKFRVTTYPQGNKLGIGLTYEDLGWITKPDENAIQSLIDNMNDFIQRKVLAKPKL